MSTILGLNLSKIESDKIKKIAFNLGRFRSDFQIYSTLKSLL